MGKVRIDCTVEKAERFGQCERFCAGYDIPTGPDAPTLADVLETLDRLTGEVRACWGMDEVYLRQKLGNTNYSIVEQRSDEALAILSAFPRAERDPRCNCPLPYRGIKPEVHEESCPVVATPDTTEDQP